MNIILKIFTIILYAYPLLLFLGIWRIFRNKPKRQLFFSILTVGLIAYFFVPTEHDDLYRYFERLEFVREFGSWSALATFYADNTYFEGAPLYFLLLTAYSSFPNWVMPVFTSVIIYTLCGTLALRACKDNNISKSETSSAILAVFYFINLYSSISSFRYVLTLAILANVIYYDLVRNDRRLIIKGACLFMYFFMGYMHTIAYSILVIRLLIFIPKTRLGTALLIALLIIWRYFSTTLVSIIGTGSASATELSARIESYTNFDEMAQIFYEVVLFVYILMLVLWIFNLSKFRGIAGGKRIIDLDYFVFFIIAFIIGNASEINMVFRYSHLLMMLFPYYYAEANRRSCYYSNANLSYIMLLFCYLLFFLYYSSQQYVLL